jgi:2-haloacid dehalogenase
MSPEKIVVAFDLYGTLLSTSSIAKELAVHFPDNADAIAATWRTYQLEYSWRLNSMSKFVPNHAAMKLLQIGYTISLQTNTSPSQK